MTVTRSTKDRLRSASAPFAAWFIRKTLRASALPVLFRSRLWNLAERYVSFYGVVAEAETRWGFRLLVDTSKMVEKQIYYFGEWEPNFSRYLVDRPARERVFVDLGANIGYFSLLASQLYAEVISIEASPGTYGRLVANIERNSIGNIRALNVAVGREVGRAAFYLDEAHSGGASLLPGEGRTFEAEVDMKPLQAILPEADLSRIGMIKVDVEGLEHVVLDQILRLLDKLPADLKILVEYGPEREGDLRAVIERFLAQGFVARMIQGPYDVSEYLDADARVTLQSIGQVPDVFCDILLERT